MTFRSVCTKINKGLYQFPTGSPSRLPCLPPSGKNLQNNNSRLAARNTNKTIEKIIDPNKMLF